MLAQGITTARIELWTLTYDGKTPESRIGAKQRVPEHIQRFQKAMRQRERRGLSAYNKREKLSAKEQDREPVLVDNSRSYIKFFPVFEFGKQNGRGHFHVMVFFESHFDVPLNALALEPEVCPIGSRRVWDLPNVRGAETPNLPPDANNLELIDYRVRQHGSQRHALWPHGFVNIECTTHDMRAVDFGGNPIERRKPSEGIVTSMFYLLKYLSKPDTKYKDCELTDDELQEQNDALKRGRGGNLLYRTGSRGLGHAFARHFGRAHASTGVPLMHIHFKVAGAIVPRSHFSLAKFQAKIEKSMGPIKAQQYMLDASRMVFQMQGGMANVAADTYLEIAKARNKDPQAMGDVAIMRLRQLEAKKANDWLRSAEGRFRRKTARQLTLLDKLWLEHRLKTARPLAASMLSGGFFDNSLPVCVLPPEPYLGYILGEDAVPDFAVLKAQGVTANTELEKLEATTDAIAIMGDAYRRVQTDAGRYQYEKQIASYQSALSAPYVAPWKVPNRDEYTQAIYEQTVSEEWEKHQSGDQDAADLIYALELARGHLYRPTLKPWSFVEFDVPQRLGLLWLNYSDQYNFPQQREQAIREHCVVRYVANDRRLIITPDGRVLMGRHGPTEKYRDTVSTGGKTFRRKMTIHKWGYRQITHGELGAAIAGVLSLKSMDKSDPIFADTDQPFKNTWAMKPDAMQSRVLGLWSDLETLKISPRADLVGIPF